MEVNETFVDFEFVTIPGFRTLSARGFAGGDLQDLRREPDGPLDTKVLVIGPVDEVCREFFEVLDISRRQGDPDFMDLGWWKGSAGGIVFLISLSDVTHGDRVRR